MPYIPVSPKNDPTVAKYIDLYMTSSLAHISSSPMQVFPD